MNMTRSEEATTAVTVQLTKPILNALVEAVLIINRADAQVAKDDHRRIHAFTPEQYVEELILVNLAERGLLKQR